MTALSTEALSAFLVASTLAMLATWVLYHGGGPVVRRVSVVACAFFAGASIGTTVALAARTPWLWSSLRVPALSATRTEAVASSRLIPEPVPALPGEAPLSPVAVQASGPSNAPGTTNAPGPRSSTASTDPSGTSTPAKTDGSRAGRLGQAAPAQDHRLRQSDVSPDPPISNWQRRGGTVVRLDGDTLTVEEMGQWTDASTRPTRTSITMTSETRIELLERSRETTAQDHLGSFKASSLARSDLRAGDYVTVTMQSTGGRHVATLIAVVRPSEEPVSIPSPMPSEGPVRSRTEARSDDGAAAIDWFLKR
jgi:hypothetical protein